MYFNGHIRASLAFEKSVICTGLLQKSALSFLKMIDSSLPVPKGTNSVLQH